MHSEVKAFMRGDFKVLEIQTSKAKYQGIKWINCSNYQKRKYENLVFLENNTGLPMKFLYV